MSTYESELVPERYELSEGPRYRFSLSRRAFMECVGAGILITAYARPASAQSPPGLDERRIAGRFRLEPDGSVRVFTGKVEVGQGSRTQISQAVAEEFGVPIGRVTLVMADTDIVPNDGGTYGSLTTPRTVPTVRRAAVSAQRLILEVAAEHWNVDPGSLRIADGVIQGSGGRSMPLSEFVTVAQNINTNIAGAPESRADLAPPSEWHVLGRAAERVGGRAIVTGAHRYPSDIKRPGMLYGKVLRPPSYGAKLTRIDVDATTGMDDVLVVRDGDFVGCVAPTSRKAQQALDRVAATAEWDQPLHPSSSKLFELLKENVREGSGRYRSRERSEGDVDGAFAGAAKLVQMTYGIPYIQHAPMEPRAAVAEWDGNRLTVWTGSQRPFGVRGELAQAFSMPQERVRVVIPDTGGGFGGKHTGDAAVEAARLAKAAGRPVSLQWTRDEEFMWAYFRPAGVIEAAVSLDASGAMTGWNFVNYNSGSSAIECPYTVPHKRVEFRYCESPLREGSYRGLAATANNFAREAFIDRVAKEAGTDPLAFRLTHLEAGRLRDVLEEAAQAFGWEQRGSDDPAVGFGLACGTEKGSYVATCAEVRVNPRRERPEIRRLVVAYECGAIQNPLNLRAQVEGAVVMSLGGALSEAIIFEDGRILNGRFKEYEVPRFKDVPPIEVVLVNRNDLSSVGAGETPIMAVAPAIANAMYDATGEAPRSLPLKHTFA